MRAGPQQSVKELFQRERLPLSELSLFLNGTYKLDVPVFTVWGACEDVSVLEKLRAGEYKIPNLQVIDESHSRLLDVGGVKLRLLGLGGAVVMHKLFDNGEGRTTIAGGQGTMWTTLLQIGELIDTANRVYDPAETRVLVTHASPAREGLLNQLSVSLKADFSISAGLHFRYGSSYNEFSVNPSLDHYRGKLSASKASFGDVWETVKHEVEPAVSENESQNKLLQYAIDLVARMPSVANGGNPFGGGTPNGQVDENAFKNMWNFNLADAAFGWLVLDIDQGRIGTEMRAQGFNFSHRGGKASQHRAQALPSGPANASMAPTGGNLPSPHQQQMPQPPNRVPSQGPQHAQQSPINQPPPHQRGQQHLAAQQLQQAAQPRPAPPQQVIPTGPSQKSTPTPSGQANGALTANGVSGPTTNLPTNGTAPPSSDTPKPADTPKQGGSPHQEPSKGIFISNAYNISTPDEVKSQLFTPEDAGKIVNLEKTTKGQWIAQFDTPEQMQEALRRGAPKEAQDKYKSMRMAPYRPAPRANYGGAGNWGAGRGGGSANARGGAEQRGGYQSAGGATTGSDSESGRGGRGRGRGNNFRGERGGGRGRGGRGGAGAERGGKSDGPQASTSSSTPTPTTTATAAPTAAPTGGDS